MLTITDINTHLMINYIT